MEFSNLVYKEKADKISIKPIPIFNKILIDYFLRLIFKNLETKKSLNMVKYNKNIMERININIKDYKKYSEKYSSIEIEIKPLNDKYGQFINVKKRDEKYYHIYFNNNKEEIKRNYIKENEYTRTHMDIEVINAMRIWMGLSALTSE